MSLVIFSTSSYGSGISPDSVDYLSAAKGMVSGEGLIGYDGSPFVLWPPFFPSILAAIDSVGIDPLDGARFFNALIFGLIIFFSSLWLLKTYKFNPLSLFGLLVIFLSVPVFWVSQYIWSEPLFILLVLVSLYMIVRFLENNDKMILVLAAIFTAIACITRYPGITIIMTGLLLLLLDRNATLKTRLINGVTFGLIASLPLVAWLVRNLIVYATLAGERTPTNTIIQSVKSAISTLSAFFLPREIDGVFRGLIFIFVSVLLCIFFAKIMRNTKHRSSIIGKQYLMPLLIFTVIYMCFMIISSTLSNADLLDQRLASPVYLPIIMLLIIGIVNLPLLWKNYRWEKVINKLLVIFLFIWLIYPFWEITTLIRDSNQDGVSGYSYSSRKWSDSELVYYLKEHSLSGQVFGNGPDVIYLNTGIRTKLTPQKHMYNAPDYQLNELPAFSKILVDYESVYVVWFENVQRGNLYDLQELDSLYDMDLVVKRSDGEIYLVREKN